MNKPKDQSAILRFRKEFTVFLSDALMGKGRATRTWFDIRNNATVERLEDFLSKELSLAEQRGYERAVKELTTNALDKFNPDYLPGNLLKKQNK